jgi:hypothetical protein
MWNDTSHLSNVNTRRKILIKKEKRKKKISNFFPPKMESRVYSSKVPNVTCNLVPKIVQAKIVYQVLHGCQVSSLGTEPTNQMCNIYPDYIYQSKWVLYQTPFRTTISSHFLFPFAHLLNESDHPFWLVFCVTSLTFQQNL